MTKQSDLFWEKTVHRINMALNMIYCDLIPPHTITFT